MKSIAQLITLSCFCGLSSLAHAQPANTISHVDIDMPMQSITSKRMVVTTPVIYKAFRQKIPRRLNTMGDEPQNKTQDNRKKDLYIEVGNRNYFVKFCSSQVTRADIETALAKQTESQPLIKLDITITKGNWDICQFDELVQSRIGRYAIVHRIINEGDVAHK